MLSGKLLLPQAGAGRRPSTAYLSFGILIGALLWLRWSGVRKGIWIDLEVYVRGAAALLRHEPLYGVSVQGQPFTYPPFAAMLFVPLELLGEVGGRWALTAVSVGCYALVVVVCARRLSVSPAVASLVGLAGLALEPLTRSLLLGQVNLVLLAMVVVDCLLVPARYRGMLIGIAAGVKLVPGAFILFLALKREWGAAFRCLVAFVVTVGLGALSAPRDSWQFWSGGLVNLSRFGADAVVRGDNQSLTGALMRITRDLTPPAALPLALSAGVLVLGLWAARRQLDLGKEVNALVCVGFASLLASPVSWTHHWVWVVPALLVLVPDRRPVVAAVLGAIFMIGPMWLAPRGDLLELSHSWWQAGAAATYVLVGLAFLMLASRGARRRTVGDVG